jgi:hypothetical protein
LTDLIKQHLVVFRQHKTPEVCSGAYYKQKNIIFEKNDPPEAAPPTEAELWVTALGDSKKKQLTRPRKGRHMSYGHSAKWHSNQISNSKTRLKSESHVFRGSQASQKQKFSDLARLATKILARSRRILLTY